MGIALINADFVGATEDIARGMPSEGLPEVAFVGRSNVGKSTLINRMTGRKKLARTSTTPGRTQQLNFFKCTLRCDSTPDTDLLLTDLPGFGYAKMSKEKREHLSEQIVNYISSRKELIAVCLLNDVRRLPEADELAIRDLAYAHDKRLLVVLTKIDKLKRSAQLKSIARVAEEYGLEPADMVASGEKVSNEMMLRRLATLL